jgi:deoxyadenosine/deoxycytidine kinase
MKPAIKEVPLPKYIAIEGPIGVGKTTLANKIAATFNYDAFLEQPAENPFSKISIEIQVSLLWLLSYSFYFKECNKSKT